MNIERFVYLDSGMYYSFFEKGNFFLVWILLICFYIFFKLFLCKFDEERKVLSKFVIDYLGFE